LQFQQQTRTGLSGINRAPLYYATQKAKSTLGQQTQGTPGGPVPSL